MNNTQIAAYCAGPEIQDCLGLCPNPGSSLIWSPNSELAIQLPFCCAGIAGIGTRGATFAQAVISGKHIRRIKHPIVIPSFRIFHDMVTRSSRQARNLLCAAPECIIASGGRVFVLWCAGQQVCDVVSRTFDCLPLVWKCSKW